VWSPTGRALDGGPSRRGHPPAGGGGARARGPGARPAGTPWLLPPPDLQLDAPAWTEQFHDEAALAEAGAALHAAGYRDVDVRELRLSDGWALMVVADAVAPGAATSATHAVWLRDHLGRLVVAGWLPSETTDQ
jgi:hypothetical protein